MLECQAVLAAHFGLDPIADVGTLMESLARRRAQACMDVLVSECGVARSQLRLTATGMGGHVRVDFIPESDADLERATPLRFVSGARIEPSKPIEGALGSLGRPRPPPMPFLRSHTQLPFRGP